MKISAFYGATAFEVGKSAKEGETKIPNKSNVEFVEFAAGTPKKGYSGERVIVKYKGKKYSVAAGQVG